MKLLSSVIIGNKKILTVKVKEREEYIIEDESFLKVNDMIFVIIVKKNKANLIEKIINWQSKKPDIVKFGEFTLVKSSLEWQKSFINESEEGNTREEVRQGKISRDILKEILMKKNPQRELVLSLLRSQTSRRSVIF